MILIALLRVVIEDFLDAGLDKSDLDEDPFDQDVDARERAAADGLPGDDPEP